MIVAYLRQLRSANDLEVAHPDFRSKRVPVKPQKLGSLDLVTLGRGQGGPDQGRLHRSQDPIIKPDRGQAVAKARKIAGKVPLKELVERLPWIAACLIRRARRIGQFPIDHRTGNDLVHMQCGDPADHVLEFADIARPVMRLETFECIDRHLFARQTLTLGLRQEMPDKIGDIFAAFAQWRKPDGHNIQPEIEVFAE